MAQPLTDAIEALTTYANTVTGASDTTLSDAVATLASGYGGGGGGILELIGTETVTQSARTFSIDMTPYNSYDVILVKADCQTSASTWIYTKFNTTEPSTQGYSYVGQYSTFTDVFYVLIRSIKPGKTFHHVLTLSTYGGNGNAYLNTNVTLTNLFMTAYEESTNILAGSKFYLYGCNYSDM